MGQDRIGTWVRYATIAVIAVAGVVVSVAAYRVEEGRARATYANDFAFDARALAFNIQRSLNDVGEALELLSNVGSLTQFREGDRFRQYVFPMIHRHPEIYAMMWLPHLPHSERDRFEGTSLSGDDCTHPVREYAVTGVAPKAANRVEYFPIAYADPRAAVGELLGLDLSTVPEYVELLQVARSADTVVGGSSASRVIEDRGLLIAKAVRGESQDQSMHAADKTAVVGLLTALVTFDALIDRSLEGQAAARLRVALTGKQRDGRESVLHAPGVGFSMGTRHEGLAEMRRGTNVESALDLPGVSWRVIVMPSDVHAAASPPSNAVAHLTIGLTVTLVVIGFLGAGVVRSNRMVGLVNELAESSAKLAERTKFAEDAERRVGALAESAPDAILVFNAQGRIVHANHRTEQAFDYPFTELLGRQVDELVPSGLRARFEDIARRIGDSEQSRAAQLESVGVDQAGRCFSIEISLSPIETDGGPCVIASMRDVSNGKALTAQFQKVLEHANDGLLPLDSKLRFVLGNPALARMFGVERVEEVWSDITRFCRPARPVRISRPMREPGSNRRWRPSRKASNGISSMRRVPRCLCASRSLRSNRRAAACSCASSTICVGAGSPSRNCDERPRSPRRRRAPRASSSQT